MQNLAKKLVIWVGFIGLMGCIACGTKYSASPTDIFYTNGYKKGDGGMSNTYFLFFHKNGRVRLSVDNYNGCDFYGKYSINKDTVTTYQDSVVFGETWQGELFLFITPTQFLLSPDKTFLIRLRKDSTGKVVPIKYVERSHYVNKSKSRKKSKRRLKIIKRLEPDAYFFEIIKDNERWYFND